MNIPKPMLAGYVYVYRAENQINGKSYIGLTNNLERRIKEHAKAARAGAQTKFHRAIRKHGMENFKWNISSECSTLDCASFSEQMLVKLTDSYRSGYNMTTGGEGRWTKVTSEKTKKKLAALYLGKTYEQIHGSEKAAEIKAAQSRKHKGKVLSAETRRRMSDANRKRWAEGSPIGKKGMPCEVDGIRYTNLTSAARAHGVTKESIKYWIAKGQHSARLS